MQNVIISGASQLGIVATNVLKEFSLVSITSKNIKIIYTDQDNDSFSHSLPLLQNHTILNIDHFTIIRQYKVPMEFNKFNPQPDAWSQYWNSFHTFDPSEVGLNDIPILDSQQNRYGISFEALMINLLQNTYNVSIKLSNTVFHNLFDYEVVFINFENCNNIINNTILLISQTTLLHSGLFL